jgi:hypothetical protein
MSDNAVPQATTVADAAAKGRVPNPQFIPLSQLSSSSVGLRDMLPLVPAALISLVFNAGFVIGMMIFYDLAPAEAHGPKKSALVEDEATKVDKEKQDKDFITDEPEDFTQAIDVTAPTEPKLPGADMEEMPSGYQESPDPNAQAGAGTGPDAGIQGAGALANEGFAGNLLADAAYGFKGDQGAGPMGDGAGIPTGRGGGSPTAGGFGARTSKSLDAIRSAGGNDASEAAVGKALRWLSAHQSPDGRWSMNGYHKHNPACKCKDMNFEASVNDNDTAGTALGLLPFLGAGHTHKKGASPYAGNVLKALQFLSGRQQNNGDLGGGMYSHALATIALCEAYGMSSDVKLRGPAQKAINFIEYAQNTQTGGWRYQPRTDGDTSVVGWQVMALRSGQMSGLTVKSQTLELAKRWLDSCQSDGGSKYSYVPGSGPTPTMTSAALLNRQYLGWGPRNPDLHKGCEYLIKSAPPPPEKPGPKEGLGQIYYYYYATQVMHHMGDKYWDTWNPRMRDFLIRTQMKKDDGHREGSWDPRGCDHGGSAGRIYSTALACLTLEVYYRHLPLYRREQAAKEPDMKPEMKKEEMKKDDKKE